MGKLEIRASFIPVFMWPLLFVSPFVELDGQRTSAAWGTRSWDVAAGMHRLRIGCPGMFGDHSVVTLEVPVYEGHVSLVSYAAPLTMLSQPTTAVAPPRPV